MGGTRVRPTHKIVALKGFGPMTTRIHIDVGKLKSKIETTTPKTDDLLKLSTVEETEALVENPTSTFHHVIVAILPPFLFTAWLDIETRNPNQLLLESI